MKYSFLEQAQVSTAVTANGGVKTVTITGASGGGGTVTDVLQQAVLQDLALQVIMIQLHQQ